MNEQMMYRILMLAGMVLGILAGAGSITLLALTATSFSFGLFVGLIGMVIATIGFGWCAVFFAQRSVGHEAVFTSVAEQEVLNTKQRRELRRVRGEVVMEAALIDVENERQNIIHNQIEASNDPDKPPHVTSFTKRYEDKHKSLPRRRNNEEL